MPRPQKFSSRMALKRTMRIAGLAAALLLAGCAGHQAYTDGKELLVQGKPEDGLAKFEEAARLDPRSTEYRAAYLRTRERLVVDYLTQAARAHEKENVDEAQRLYRRILDIAPANEPASAGLKTLDAGKRHTRLLDEAKAALEKKNLDTAQLNLATILAENPAHDGALFMRRTLEEKNAKPPLETELAAAYRKPITIEFKDVALKQVFEVISRTSGLNFLFDREVKTDQKTSIFLKNSTIASAVHFTLLTNQLAQQVLDANTILIYPNTPAKTKDYQEMVVKTFFLSNADAKTLANSLKTIVKSRDVVIDEKLNMLIVRDSPEAVALAEKLIALQDVPEPEVMLEVEILEVKRSRLLELGVQWPDSLTLAPIPSTAAGTLTVRDLKNLDSSSVSATIPAFTVNARQQDSDANILANPRIRARNHEKAKIMIGERIPNITTTSTATGFVSESINYVDVGLKLEVEPTVYLDNDVAIKVALEVSNIVSQLQTNSGSVAYQIGTRNASTVLRLKDGENQVLAGLINDEDRNSAKKVPGLGEVPVIGRLFGSHADNSQKTEIILSITPRIIRNIQRPEASLSEFRAGTDSSFRVRPASVAAPIPEGGRSGAVPGAAAPSSSRPSTPSSQDTAASNVQPNSGPVAPASTSDPTRAPDEYAARDPVISGGPAQLRWQGPAQASISTDFSMQLIMQSDQPVTSLPLAIGFDSKLLQVTGVVEGDFLKQGGAQTSFSSRVDPNGQILLTSTRSGDNGATTVGTVATISFRPIAASEAARVQILTAAPTGLAGRPVPASRPAPHVLRIQP